MIRARRFLPLLLFITPLVHAQALDALVAEALRPDASPEARIAGLKQIVNQPGGVEALVAKGGLDPAGDVEVVHAVVDILIRNDRHLDQIEHICLLLASDNEVLWRKVARRILREGEDSAAAAAMVERLRDLALGVSAGASTEYRIRLGAVRALARIPLRGAVDLIVEAWETETKSKTPAKPVLDECPRALANVVPVLSPERARRYLARRPGATYWDLRETVSALRARELERLRDYVFRSLRTASAADAFSQLTREDEAVRAAAAERINALATKSDFGGAKPDQFAKRTFEALAAEGDRTPPSVQVSILLAEALVELATQPWKDSPLAKGVGASPIVTELQPLARMPSLSDQLGLACVRLLDAMGDEGTIPLIAFARHSRNPDLRIEAVRRLAKRARQGGADQARVGAELTDMLLSERDRDVRKQVLISLKQAPVAGAAKPLRALLLPAEGAASDLSTVEAQDCIAILRQIPGDEAIETLFAVVGGHPDLEVRGLAIREGLLPRALAGNGEARRILDRLQTVVMDPKQPLEVRVAIVRAMGERGNRALHPVLVAFEKDEGAPAEVRGAARGAKLRLAERLVAPPNGAPVREDLAAAVAILAEEAERGDPTRLSDLAGRIVATGTTRKLPVGAARALHASVYARRKDAKREELLALYEAAANNVAQDGLAPVAEERLLKAYRTKLLEEAAPEPARVATAIGCSERLAELAGADKSKAAGHLLDAAQDAVRLTNRTLAESILAKIEKLGPLEGAPATRLAEIREATNALPPK